MLRPAICFSHSPQMCGLVPEPPEAKVYLPGLAFTSATSSGTVFAGMSGLMTKMFGTCHSMLTGVKSFSASNGSLL